MKQLIPLLAMLAFLPGCIAWEIRDDMRTVNQSIRDVNATVVDTGERVGIASDGITRASTGIEQANTLLAEANSQLVIANAQLTQVQASINATREQISSAGSLVGDARPLLSTANQNLDRLQVVSEVQASLKQVNAALGPLAKTMNALEGSMSFFGGGSDETTAPADTAPGEKPAATTPPTGTTPTPAPAATDAGDRGKAAAITGTWLGAFTSESLQGAEAFVLLTDGQFLRAKSGQVAVRGSWIRSGSTLKLQPEGSPQPAESVMDIVTLTPRILTLRSGDRIKVYTRP